MNSEKSAWQKIIEVIDKPLGFFALALLIIESFFDIKSKWLILQHHYHILINQIPV